MSTDMIILSKTFNLLEWLIPKSGRFPRVYRFTVTQRMMDAALDFQEALFEAQSCREKARYVVLQRCDAALNKLRLYLRLAVEWKWFNQGQYQHVSLMVAEIGRLLGGWIKQTPNR